MLSKILITLTVITIAFFVIRQRHLGTKPIKKETNVALPSSKESRYKDELSKDMRAGAYFFLLLMVSLGTTLYYFDWQDDHTIVTVNLHRGDNSDIITYEVYKYQLGERSFLTIDGRNITVASNERMEVIGL